MECAASAKRLSTVFSSCLGCFHILTQLYVLIYSVAKELASVLRKGAKRLKELIYCFQKLVGVVVFAKVQVVKTTNFWK